jgi:hypothetical protein
MKRKLSVAIALIGGSQVRRWSYVSGHHPFFSFIMDRSSFGQVSDQFCRQQLVPGATGFFNQSHWVVSSVANGAERLLANVGRSMNHHSPSRSPMTSSVRHPRRADGGDGSVRPACDLGVYSQRKAESDHSAEHPRMWRGPILAADSSSQGHGFEPHIECLLFFYTVK